VSDAPTGADLARGWFENSPFIGHLGMRLVSIGDDEAVVELPFSDALPTAGDLVHGGAIASLLDTAAAAAAWSSHDPANGMKWGTVGISTSFLAPARGADLRATARVTRRGRAVVFCSVHVETTDGAAVADALVSYRLG
jgi:uncharacterized protein (TIGR00369 family)